MLEVQQLPLKCLQEPAGNELTLSLRRPFGTVERLEPFSGWDLLEGGDFIIA